MEDDVELFVLWRDLIFKTSLVEVEKVSARVESQEDMLVLFSLCVLVLFSFSGLFKLLGLLDRY